MFVPEFEQSAGSFECATSGEVDEGVVVLVLVFNRAVGGCESDMTGAAVLTEQGFRVACFAEHMVDMLEAFDVSVWKTLLVGDK